MHDPFRMEKITLPVKWIPTILEYRISVWFFSVRSVVVYIYRNIAFILACFSLYFNTIEYLSNVCLEQKQKILDPKGHFPAYEGLIQS